MAYKPKKPKQKLHEPTIEELRKRGVLAFAQLLYDIYQDKKEKEKNNEVSSSI
jgi:hypothetical protein